LSIRDKLILFVSLFVLGFIAHYLWGDNNVIEEVAEDILKQQYGLDVEFSKTRR
jgi:hypothetical protein